MSQQFEPLNIEDFPPDFIQQYGPACHLIVEMVATMASKGEVDNIILLVRLFEKVVNCGMVIIEEAKKQERKQWQGGWAFEGRA